MSTALRGESGELQLPKLTEPENFTCVIISTRWNAEIVDKLEEGAVKTLLECGVPEKNIVRLKVPGAVELTYAAAYATNMYYPSAIITLGCVIRGDTPHFDYVCMSATQGITSLNVNGDVPVIFGVLTVDNLTQAQERAGGILGNKGAEAAVAAIEMEQMKDNVQASLHSHPFLQE